jgi:hypothetical protein
MRKLEILAEGKEESMLRNRVEAGIYVSTGLV